LRETTFVLRKNDSVSHKNNSVSREITFVSRESIFVSREIIFVSREIISITHIKYLILCENPLISDKIGFMSQKNDSVSCEMPIIYNIFLPRLLRFVRNRSQALPRSPFLEETREVFL
jgi:hypothetical protein